MDTLVYACLKKQAYLSKLDAATTLHQDLLPVSKHVDTKQTRVFFTAGKYTLAVLNHLVFATVSK